MTRFHGKVRIESDGTPTGTRVHVGDQDITPYVSGVTWRIGVDGLAKATLEMTGVIADVSAELEQEQAEGLQSEG